MAPSCVRTLLFERRWRPIVKTVRERPSSRFHDGQPLPLSMYNRIMTLSYVNERKEESLSSGMPSKDEKRTNKPQFELGMCWCVFVILERITRRRGAIDFFSSMAPGWWLRNLGQIHTATWDHNTRVGEREMDSGVSGGNHIGSEKESAANAFRLSLCCPGIRRLMLSIYHVHQRRTRHTHTHSPTLLHSSSFRRTTASLVHEKNPSLEYELREEAFVMIAEFL